MYIFQLFNKHLIFSTLNQISAENLDFFVENLLIKSSKQFSTKQTAPTKTTNN